MNVIEIVAVGALILGVLKMYMQIQETHKANIKAQDAHLKNQLKLRIYDESSSIFHRAADLIGTSHIDVVSIVSTLKLMVKYSWLPPTKTSQELAEAHYAGADALSDVLHRLEQYEIVFVHFGSMRRQLAEEHRRFLESYSKISEKVGLYLPHADPDGGDNLLRAITVPKKENLPELEELKRDYSDVCGDITAYILDLQIEAQNELLGPLFDRTLPPRAPLDSGMKVLARDSEAPTERPPGRIV